MFMWRTFATFRIDALLNEPNKHVCVATTGDYAWGAATGAVGPLAFVGQTQVRGGAGQSPSAASVVAAAGGENGTSATQAP